MAAPNFESLMKKVIVRFRHKAGKNGQMFPQKSWMSGFLIISSRRLILASGAFHHMIPLQNVMDLEDYGNFPTGEATMDKVVPVSFSSGIDVYLTLVAVTPPVKRRVLCDLYSAMLASFSSFEMEVKENRFPCTISTTLEGLLVVPLEESGTGSLTLTPSMLEGVEFRKDEGVSMIVPGEEDRPMMSIHSQKNPGEWLRKSVFFVKGLSHPPLTDRYIKVMRYLKDNPATTSSLSSNLSLVALEASTMLNEMIYLDWVIMDHDSKLYALTPEGANVLQKST